MSIHSSGQTHISLKIEEVVSLENEIDWTTVPLEQIIGCDLGLTHFLIDSNGNKIDNPRYLKGYEDTRRIFYPEEIKKILSVIDENS